MYFRGEYDFLSNFYPAYFHVEVGKDLWPFASVENAYQAAKSSDPEVWKWMSRIPPREAKKYGRTIRLRPNWDQLKLPIMEMLVGLKFQDPELRFLLNDTGDIPLIEDNRWGDRFWGMCNGTGENHLGKILMKVRSLNRVESQVKIS